MGAAVGTDCLFCFVYAVHIPRKGGLKHSVHYLNICLSGVYELLSWLNQRPWIKDGYK